MALNEVQRVQKTGSWRPKVSVLSLIICSEEDRKVGSAFPLNMKNAN